MTEHVIVTGASSGLGKAIALALAEAGFRVHATLRDPDRSGPLEEAARARGVSLNVLRLDVTVPETFREALARVGAETDAVYGLINNAGIHVRGFFEDLDEAEIREVFETNVFGALRVTRAVLPGMRRAGRGRIVFIGSVGGRIATLGSSPYCATKFALEGFAEALYQEVRPLGLHVSIVEPGIVRTELFGRNRRVGRRALDPDSPYHRWFQNLERATDARVASRTLSPDDVAREVVRVLRAPDPRIHHVVGPLARWLVLGKRLLPRDAMDRMYTRKLWQHIGERSGPPGKRAPTAPPRSRSD